MARADLFVVESRVAVTLSSKPDMYALRTYFCYKSSAMKLSRSFDGKVRNEFQLEEHYLFQIVPFFLLRSSSKIFGWDGVLLVFGDCFSVL